MNYDCFICFAKNTRQLIELPCGHNVKTKLKETKNFLVCFFLNSYAYHVFT